MTHSHTALKGHMTLTLFDAHGNQISQHENHNRVLLSGQQLLLNLLRGEASKPSISPLLGSKEFDSTKPADGQKAKTMTLEDVVQTDVKLDGNMLTLSYSGVASKKMEIVGGGLLVSSARSSGQEVKELYNFASLKTPVGVGKSMNMSLNFSLSVGG